MDDRIEVGRGVIRLEKCDITDYEIECFVYYARSDLKLGSGFGGAITVRGGPSIQQQLDQIKHLDGCQAVISEAGELKAKYIIHANGPKFQEENTEEKLRQTILNIFKLAEEKGIQRIALPAMGAGFYGVPLDVSARIGLETAAQYLNNGSGIKEIVFCLLDNREYKPYESRLTALRTA